MGMFKRMSMLLWLAAVGLPIAYAADAAPSETVSGTVVYSSPYNFFIVHDGSRAMYVTSRQGTPQLEPGDVVTATGFPSLRDGRHSLEVATYERTDRAAPLPPTVEMAMDGLASVLRGPSPDSAYGMRVRLKARVESVAMRHWGETEATLVGDAGISVTMRHLGPLPDKLFEDLSLGPEVEATGVLVFDLNQLKRTAPTVYLRVQDADDIAVVRSADFLRRRLARSASKLLRLIPVALLAAVVYLVARLYSARNERLRLEAVLAERKRMSADMHDSIEQHVAMARLYLESVLSSGDEASAETLGTVGRARDILASVKREIRDTIWNLRVGELAGKRPADVFRDLAARLSGMVQVSVRLQDFPETLPENLFSNMLNIVQESVTNAVRHGGATRIVIAGRGEGRRVLLYIANNGTPFDPGRTLGPESGHYGLAGMRERARRSGIALSFASHRHVTSVRMEART